jgi:hypothetical protein
MRLNRGNRLKARLRLKDLRLNSKYTCKKNKEVAHDEVSECVGGGVGRFWKKGLFHFVL